MESTVGLDTAVLKHLEQNIAAAGLRHTDEDLRDLDTMQGHS